MAALTRRDVVALIAAAVVSAAVGSPIAAAEEEKPLTPAAVVEQKFEGQATLEFLVGVHGTGKLLGDGSEYGGVTGLHLSPADAPAGGRVRVWVLMKPTHDLFRLGIDPLSSHEHFRGKVVRVRGEITRTSDSNGPLHQLKVESLDQFEAVHPDRAVPAPVQVEVTGRLVYKKWLRESPEGLYRVDVGNSAVYLTFASGAAKFAARELVGEKVTVKGTLTLGVLEKRGATRPEGDVVVDVAEIVPAK